MKPSWYPFRPPVEAVPEGGSEGSEDLVRQRGWCDDYQREVTKVVDAVVNEILAWEVATERRGNNFLAEAVRCGDFARTGRVEWGTGNPPGISAPGGADEEGVDDREGSGGGGGWYDSASVQG